MAKMIRIGFHDCVGGCDGCLNVDNDSNAGLSGIVATLEDLFNDEVRFARVVFSAAITMYQSRGTDLISTYLLVSQRILSSTILAFHY